MNNNSFYERAADTNRYFRVMKSFDNNTPAHFHNTTEIIVVVSGAERVVINGVERTLTRGDIGVSNSFDIHYYECEGSSEVTVVMLSVEYLSRFKETFGVCLGNFLPYGDKSDEIIATIDKLFAVQNGNPLISAGYIDVMLGQLYDAFPNCARSNGDGGKVVEILRYIEDNYAERLSLKSVASRFGYSETYFSQMFNRFVGMHFRDYVNRLRVSRAAEMAAEGRKVLDIAASCGFDSLNTYYRAVKKWRPQP